MKHKLLFVLMTTFLLMGCASQDGNTTNSSSKIDEDTSQGSEAESSMSEGSSSIDEDTDDTEVPELSDISTGISIPSSGFLGDISVGMSLATHSEYGISFTLRNNPTDVVNVYTDNPNVLTVEVSESGTSYKLITHKAGKSHLIIEDGDTIIHYRKLIQIKKKKSKEEIDKLLVDTDHWGAHEGFKYFTGSLEIVFMEGAKGYMSGTESGGVTLNNESFNYAYDGAYSSISEEHEHWYIYRVSNWQETSFVFDYFAVWNTGDWLHAHTRNSLLGVLVPMAEA